MQTTCHVSGQRRCPGKSPNPYFRSGSVSSQSTFQHPGPRTLPFATSQLLYEHPKPYESTVSSTYSASSSVATSEESSVAARPAATAASLAQIPTSTAHRFEALPSSTCARPCVIPAVRAALAAALPAAAAACARRAKKAVGRLCPVAKNRRGLWDLRGVQGLLHARAAGARHVHGGLHAVPVRGAFGANANTAMGHCHAAPCAFRRFVHALPANSAATSAAPCGVRPADSFHLLSSAEVIYSGDPNKGPEHTCRAFLEGCF